MDNKIKPIIKWTGGKYREFPFFAHKIPSFKRYVEPFFGGGGVFFALQPQTSCAINDKSKDLIRFYRSITNPKFQQELLRFADAWEELGVFAHELWPVLKPLFLSGKNSFKLAELLEVIQTHIKHFPTLADSDFHVDEEAFILFLAESIQDKSSRIARIVLKENRVFDEQEYLGHFETAIKGGFYLYFRKLLNAADLGDVQLTAIWYFVRELCYAAMFRYNAKGEFNIPYGGMAYNKKNIRQKIDAIFQSSTQQLFAKTSIYQLDFEEFLNDISLTKDDFVFVDPPYDSEFSEYDQNTFNAADQNRLASYLKQCPAKWMVVIKETPLIRSLYTAPGIEISTFDKNYTYNVRGRNNRNVTHLLITNY